MNPVEQEWCGCCGQGFETYDGTIHLWCGNCAGHVKDDGMPWDATFQAQHGRPCPYQPKVFR